MSLCNLIRVICRAPIGHWGQRRFSASSNLRSPLTAPYGKCKRANTACCVRHHQQPQQGEGRATLNSYNDQTCAEYQRNGMAAAANTSSEPVSCLSTLCQSQSTWASGPTTWTVLNAKQLAEKATWSKFASTALLRWYFAGKENKHLSTPPSSIDTYANLNTSFRHLRA